MEVRVVVALDARAEALLERLVVALGRAARVAPAGAVPATATDSDDRQPGGVPPSPCAAGPLPAPAAEQGAGAPVVEGSPAPPPAAPAGWWPDGVDPDADGPAAYPWRTLRRKAVMVWEYARGTPMAEIRRLMEALPGPDLPEGSAALWRCIAALGLRRATDAPQLSPHEIGVGAAVAPAPTDNAPAATIGPSEPPALQQREDRHVAEPDGPKARAGAPAFDAVPAGGAEPNDTQRAGSGEPDAMPWPLRDLAAEQGAETPAEHAPAPPAPVAPRGTIPWRTPEREVALRRMVAKGDKTPSQMHAVLAGMRGPPLPAHRSNIDHWMRQLGLERARPEDDGEHGDEEEPAASPVDAPRETPQLKRALELVAQFVHPNDVKNAVKLSSVEFALVQRAWRERTTGRAA